MNDWRDLPEGEERDLLCLAECIAKYPEEYALKLTKLECELKIAEEQADNAHDALCAIRDGGAATGDITEIIQLGLDNKPQNQARN